MHAVTFNRRRRWVLIMLLWLIVCYAEMFVRCCNGLIFLRHRCRRRGRARPQICAHKLLIQLTNQSSVPRGLIDNRGLMYLPRSSTETEISASASYRRRMPDARPDIQKLFLCVGWIHALIVCCYGNFIFLEGIGTKIQSITSNTVKEDEFNVIPELRY